MLQCALDTSYWTGVNHFVIWGSLLFYFAFTFTFYADVWGYEYRGTARNTMSTANFWFTLVLTVVVLLVPVVAERFYYIDTRPTLTDKVRLKQKISKSKSKSGELILRRASTMRRSTRSLNRSGYAFAHQEGFGNLITSGTNMRGQGASGRTTTSSSRTNGGGPTRQTSTQQSTPAQQQSNDSYPGNHPSNPHIPQQGNSNHNNSRTATTNDDFSSYTTKPASPTVHREVESTEL